MPKRALHPQAATGVASSAFRRSRRPRSSGPLSSNGYASFDNIHPGMDDSMEDDAEAPSPGPRPRAWSDTTATDALASGDASASARPSPEGSSRRQSPREATSARSRQTMTRARRCAPGRIARRRSGYVAVSAEASAASLPRPEGNGMPRFQISALTLPDRRPKVVAGTGSVRRPSRGLRGRRSGRFGLLPRRVGGRSACGHRTSRSSPREDFHGGRPRAPFRDHRRNDGRGLLPRRVGGIPWMPAVDQRPRTPVHGWVPSRGGSVLMGPRVRQHPGAPEGMPGRSGYIVVYGRYQRKWLKQDCSRLIKSASREPTSGLRMLHAAYAPATEAAGSSKA
jgi:hypothetical protein